MISLNAEYGRVAKFFDGARPASALRIDVDDVSSCVPGIKPISRKVSTGEGVRTPRPMNKAEIGCIAGSYSNTLAIVPLRSEH
jgi:hypothetical protein